MILPCVEKSSGVTAPFERIPTLKMPRSSIFTFLPSISSSLIQFTMSFSMPWMAPVEKGVLWVDMCSAKAAMSTVSSHTARAYHLLKVVSFFSFLF